MPKRRRPSICIDEHLPLDVKEQFRAAGFRAFRASESRYKSRDEHDYLNEMYSRNEVFVTADGEFIDDLMESGFRRHAGVVWLPEQLDYEQRTGFSELAADSIKFQVWKYGSFAMRGIILYPSKDGVTVFDGKKDQLIISWDRMMTAP